MKTKEIQGQISIFDLKKPQENYDNFAIYINPPIKVKETVVTEKTTPKRRGRKPKANAEPLCYSCIHALKRGNFRLCVEGGDGYCHIGEDVRCKAYQKQCADDAYALDWEEGRSTGASGR